MDNKNIEKKLCKITEKAIETLVDSIEDKKNPKIEDTILLWNAIDFYYERCENSQKDGEIKDDSPEFYV